MHAFITEMLPFTKSIFKLKKTSPTCVFLASNFSKIISVFTCYHYVVEGEEGIKGKAVEISTEN